jgi:hypothetical protein
MFKSSEPLMEKKFSEHAVATALATSVLPIPGSTYSRLPVDQRHGTGVSSESTRERVPNERNAYNRTPVYQIGDPICLSSSYKLMNYDFFFTSLIPSDFELSAFFFFPG